MPTPVSAITLYKFYQATSLDWVSHGYTQIVALIEGVDNSIDSIRENLLKS